MRCSTTFSRAEFDGLYAAYREAWQQFVLRTGYWQLLARDEHAPPADVKAAYQAAHEAEAHYRQARDVLAEHILDRNRRSAEREMVA